MIYTRESPTFNIVTVGPDHDSGYRVHLEELAYCTEQQGIYVRVMSRGPESLAEIRRYDPSLTIIGGRNWILRNHEILPKIPGKKGILYCSPLAQAEISGEEIRNLVEYLAWLDSRKIDYLFTGSESLSRVLDRSDVLHLPAPFVSRKQPYKGKRFPLEKSVGILNDKAPHKNTMNALAGVASSTSVEHLIVNRMPKEFEDMLRFFRLHEKTTIYDTLVKERYEQIIDETKLLLHLSFSEGFCYAILESLYRGTPILVTSTIPWCKHDSLQIIDPNDPIEIARKIDTILQMSPEDYSALAHQCRTIAESAIEENNRKAKITLERVLNDG